MFRRQLLDQLLQWAKKDNRKPLVLRGARQVGKTTLVSEFGKQFDHFISLNLELNSDAEMFRRYNDVEDVINYIFLRNHITQNKQKRILLFIDEIQEEELAIPMLRYFYEKAPWLYVITAGSRLQSLVKKHISFPVGRVEYMTLRPFSFSEYLEARDGIQWVNALENMKIDEMMHSEMMKIFNEYALVGGMPEAVATYLDTRDLEKVAPIYRSLQNGYAEDVERYGKNNTQIAVMRHILQYGWANAGKSITFAKFAGSTYTSTAVHEAMDVLQKAFVLTLDYPLTSSNAPAIPSLSRSPKLIWADTGLVNFFANIQIEYLHNKDLLDTWRGCAAEHIVAQELRVVLDRNMRDEQYFWVRDKKGASAEIDFVWTSGSQIIPIEVKAGTNSHLRSLHTYVNTSDHMVTAVRIWSGEYCVQETKTPAPDNKPYKLINLPFYYVGMIDKILKINE